MNEVNNKKKRICILHHVNSLGGGTKSFIDLVLMLKEEYEVIACIPLGESPLKQILLEHKIKICEINLPYPQYPRYSGGPNLVSRTMLLFLYNLKYIKAFCRLIEKMEPEMVIYNSIVTIISAPFLSSNIKKVCFVRETIVSKDACFLFKRILKNNFEGACFLSHYDERLLYSDNLNSIVIPDSMSLGDVFISSKQDARVKEGVAQDDYVVLYMGGDDRIKGTDTILKAFRYVDKRKKLIIAGRFERTKLKRMRLWNIKEVVYRYRIEKYYKYLENQGKVLLAGMRRDISSLMCACDIVVFPSTKVHQSRPCIEAGFYHKPVIISDYEQTKEYFIDGYNSLTFRSRNVRELAKKIEFACDNSEKMQVIGENNYKMSITHHNYEKIQKDLHNFIINIIAETL